LRRETAKGKKVGWQDGSQKVKKRYTRGKTPELGLKVLNREGSHWVRRAGRRRARGTLGWEDEACGGGRRSRPIDLTQAREHQEGERNAY